MNYVVDFLIISFIYLSITTIFYFKQNKISNDRNRYFSMLLIIGLVSIVFDIITAKFNLNTNIPIWLVYITNILFLFCVQLNGPIFLGYSLILTGTFPRINKFIRLLIFIPFIIVCILLMISPFTRNGIFYIDTGNIYTNGATHSALYIILCIYLLTSFVISILKYHSIQKRKILVIFSFLLITFLAMLIQLFNPQILVNSMGNALALTIVYHTLQIADEHIDPLTRLLNGKSLEQIIQELYEQNQNYTVYIYSLEEFQIINQEYGVKDGDDLMVSFAKYLEKKYPKCYVIRIIGDMYGVIEINPKNKLDFKSLNKISLETPKKWIINNNDIILNVNLSGFNSYDFVNKTMILNIFEYIQNQHERKLDVPVLFVDKDYSKKIEYYYQVEEILKKSINDKSLEVYYQPIHNEKGVLVAFEALCRIYDKELGFISPDLFIDIAEKNGLILQLGKIVLEKVCMFIANNDVKNWSLHHIGVNLSFVQCTSLEIYQSLMEVLDKYDLPKKLISFEITETAFSPALSIVKENMEKFIANGFNFMLDDFGSGYANYNYVLALPFKCIKIDKNLLWKAMKSNKDLVYLKSVVKALKKLNLLIVCEGVETEEQSDLLNEMGVNMKQGYLYSKALNENNTIEYVRNQSN